MKKQGQITFFIILGIIIVVIFVIYISIASTQKKIVTIESSETPQVKAYLDNCLEASAKKSFAEIGEKGGKLSLEEPYYSNDILDTNYLYGNYNVNAVDSETLKLNLKKDIEIKLKDCFSNFSASGFEIRKENPNVTVEFTDSGTIISASYPVDIVKDGKVQKIDKLEPVFLSVRLRLINEVAANITHEISKNPNQIEFIPLLKNGMNITVDMTPRNALFLIIDPMSSIEQKPYGFIFAVNFQNTTK